MSALSLEALIAAINAAGYNVYLHQYDKRVRTGETRWEATATSMYRDNVPKSHVYMDEICFGRDPRHALGKLLDKCQAAPAKPRGIHNIDNLFEYSAEELAPGDHKAKIDSLFDDEEDVMS